jgi:hypothetical protein
MDSTGFVASDNRLVMRNTIIAAITTIVLNLVVYFIGDAAGWIPDDLPERADNFGIPAIIVSTLIPIIGGGIVLTLLIHTTTHPVLMFCLISSVVFIATLAAPLSVAGSHRSFATFLVALHVITVVVGVALLIRNVADEPE